MITTVDLYSVMEREGLRAVAARGGAERLRYAHRLGFLLPPQSLSLPLPEAAPS